LSSRNYSAAAPSTADYFGERYLGDGRLWLLKTGDPSADFLSFDSLFLRANYELMLFTGTISFLAAASSSGMVMSTSIVFIIASMAS